MPIGRQALWILELFGSDRDGVSLAKRFFRRTNPERKRPGPVSVAVNLSMISPESIRIEFDGLDISNDKELLRLAENIEIPQGSSARCYQLRSGIQIPREAPGSPISRSCVAFLRLKIHFGPR